jgi:hypothetical protein
MRERAALLDHADGILLVVRPLISLLIVMAFAARGRAQDPGRWPKLAGIGDTDRGRVEARFSEPPRIEGRWG